MIAAGSTFRSAVWISLILGFVTIAQPALARADLIDVENPSFENVTGSFVFNEFTFGPPVGWQFYDPNNLIVNLGAGPQFWPGTLAPSPPIFLDSIPDGNRVAILYNTADSGNLGEYGFQQTLAATLQPNSIYSLQVEIGNIASGTAVNNQFFDLSGFPGYRVDLLAGGVVIASDNNSLAGAIPEGGWGTSLVQFQTAAAHAQLGQPLSIRLVNLNVIDPLFPTADLEVDFDHIRFHVSSIPEPSTLILLGLTSSALLRRRRCLISSHDR